MEASPCFHKPINKMKEKIVRKRTKENGRGKESSKEKRNEGIKENNGKEEN